MKSYLLAAALMLPAAAALAQAPATPTTTAVGGPVLVVTAEQVAQTVARARAAYAADAAKSPNTRQGLLSAKPYGITLEHRMGQQGFATHGVNAELLYVIEGTGSVTTGGTLTGGAPAAANGDASGTGITGGTTRRFVPGDMILVPEGTPHTLAPDAGQALIVGSMYVPRTGRFAPPATPSATPPKTFHAAADLPAMSAKAKAAVAASPRFFGGDTILSLPPYRTGLEYRSPKGIASVHGQNAEIMWVLDGEGIIEAGGTLVAPRGTGANVDGDAIQGGTEYKLKKGDMIFVPRGVPHLARSEGTFVLATMHLPAD